MIQKPLWLFRLFLVVLIIGSSWYGITILEQRLDVRKCLLNPEQYDGSYIDYMIELKVKKLTDFGFVGEERGTLVNFLTTDKTFEVGERVEAAGIFHKDGSITVTKFNRFPKELFHFKVIVSAIAAVSGTIYFLICYRKYFLFGARRAGYA